MTPESWLRDKLADRAPDELLDCMVAALPDNYRSVADAFAEGAMSLYREVVSGSGGREVALALLAADALFTHAFEAQAETDIDGIADLVMRYGATGQLTKLAV